MLKTLKQEAKITEAVLRVSPSVLHIYCEGWVDGPCAVFLHTPPWEASLNAVFMCMAKVHGGAAFS